MLIFNFSGQMWNIMGRFSDEFQMDLDIIKKTIKVVRKYYVSNNFYFYILMSQ